MALFGPPHRAEDIVFAEDPQRTCRGHPNSVAGDLRFSDLGEQIGGMAYIPPHLRGKQQQRQSDDRDGQQQPLAESWGNRSGGIASERNNRDGWGRDQAAAGSDRWSGSEGAGGRSREDGPGGAFQGERGGWHGRDGGGRGGGVRGGGGRGPFRCVGSGRPGFRSRRPCPSCSRYSFLIWSRYRNQGTMSVGPGTSTTGSKAQSSTVSPLQVRTNVNLDPLACIQNSCTPGHAKCLSESYCLEFSAQLRTIHRSLFPPTWTRVGEFCAFSPSIDPAILELVPPAMVSCLVAKSVCTKALVRNVSLRADLLKLVAENWL